MLETSNPSHLLESDSFTETEILGQPDLWLKLWKHFQSVKFDLKNYLDKVLDNNETRIILTGAGTSAFHRRCTSWSI